MRLQLRTQAWAEAIGRCARTADPATTRQRHGRPPHAAGWPVREQRGSKGGSGRPRARARRPSRLQELSCGRGGLGPRSAALAPPWRPLHAAAHRPTKVAAKDAGLAVTLPWRPFHAAAHRPTEDAGLAVTLARSGHAGTAVPMGFCALGMTVGAYLGGCEGKPTMNAALLAREIEGVHVRLADRSPPMLTSTVCSLRAVRTGYAYQPPACCTYRRHRAAAAPQYVHRTCISLGRAVRTAYRGTAMAPQAAAGGRHGELHQVGPGGRQHWQVTRVSMGVCVCGVCTGLY